MLRITMSSGSLGRRSTGHFEAFEKPYGQVYRKCGRNANSVNQCVISSWNWCICREVQRCQ